MTLRALAGVPRSEADADSGLVITSYALGRVLGLALLAAALGAMLLRAAQRKGRQIERDSQLPVLWMTFAAHPPR